MSPICWWFYFVTFILYWKKYQLWSLKLHKRLGTTMKYWNSTCFLLSYACHGKVCINNYLTQPSLVHQYFCVEKWTNKASALHHKSNLKWFIKTTNCKFTNMFHFSISTTSWPWVFFDKYLNDLIFFNTIPLWFTAK